MTGADMNAEGEMIACCLRGDAAAWDALFDAHYAATARFIFQLGWDFTADDVDEITQETFLSVVRNLEAFGAASRLSTWIFRIAANKAHDHRARSNAVKRGGGQALLSLQATDPVTGLGLDPASPAPGPDQSVMQQERWRLLRRSMDDLEPPCREIIELRYFAELSYEDIAQALRVNPKTVSSRLSRCLDRLEIIATTVFERDERETERRSTV
jgi:RNA polymerase sigma-70 factor (ECF subfamily)